jgi:hypothetical protein
MDDPGCSLVVCRAVPWVRPVGIVRLLGISLLALLLAGSTRAQEPSTSDQRSVLNQILLSTYQPTVVGKGLMGFGADDAIRRAGTVVVVQRPGLYGSLSRNEIASMAIHGREASLYRGNKDYVVPVGERFYVFSISTGSDFVSVGLLSTRTIAVGPRSAHVWTSINVFFPEKSLANAEKDVVYRELDDWFVPEGRAAASAAASAPIPAAPAVTPTPAAAPAPPAPEPPVATPPAVLQMGMTREEVTRLLGPAQHEISFESRTWLSYPGVVVVMAYGKLNSVETSTPIPAKIAIHSEPPGAEIYLDTKMVGSSPSTLNVPPGDHDVRVVLAGHADWLRKVHVLAGSEIQLSAQLESR